MRLSPKWKVTRLGPCKEWFDKVNGNSYFSSDVTLNYGMNNQKTIKLGEMKNHFPINILISRNFFHESIQYFKSLISRNSLPELDFVAVGIRLFYFELIL